MKIDYRGITLSNGLRVLVHTDPNTALVAFNLLYKVGAKNEDPRKTGFAHLFEHLMFSGSKHVKDYDEALDKVGGTTNAFTNNDFTNFYISLPREAVETAFFVESDRMQNLTLTQKKLDVQKGVVVEEFKERCLNQPYGDTDMLLRPLSYRTHPYAWSTLGKEIAHIESVSLQDAKTFYNTFYIPDNAILSVSGPVEPEEMFALAEKWFGNIPRGGHTQLPLPVEPVQREAHRRTVERKVPSNAFFRTYHMGPRMSSDFYVFDLMSDLLSIGESSRFYTRLVKERKLFSNLDAYVSGDMEPGLFLISGIMEDGVDFEKSEQAVEEELARLGEEKVDEKELQKVKNKSETALIFSNMKGLDKAMNLGYFEMMASADALSHEVEAYRAVTVDDIRRVARAAFVPSNSNTLYYKAIK